MTWEESESVRMFVCVRRDRAAINNYDCVFTSLSLNDVWVSKAFVGERGCPDRKSSIGLPQSVRAFFRQHSAQLYKRVRYATPPLYLHLCSAYKRISLWFTMQYVSKPRTCLYTHAHTNTLYKNFLRGIQTDILRPHIKISLLLEVKEVHVL